MSQEFVVMFSRLRERAERIAERNLIILREFEDSEKDENKSSLKKEIGDRSNKDSFATSSTPRPRMR